MRKILPRKDLKLAPLLALAFGLAFTGWLISTTNLPALIASFANVGWGVAAIVAVRATMIATNGIAWARLLERLADIPVRIFILSRWIRDAVDAMLPVAGVGGSLVGARILTFWKMPVRLAAAGAVADLLVQTIAQALFALSGALLLARFSDLQLVVPTVFLGAAIATAALAGFYFLQRYAGARFADRILECLSRWLTLPAVKAGLSFRIVMEQIWRGRWNYVFGALALHALAWTFGTLEVFIALRCMQWPVTAVQAVILESLGASISSAAFLIPGSWGVQEGGYILIGHMLGVPMSFSLALSFVKRVPDLVLGVSGLAVWYVLETRNAVGAITGRLDQPLGPGD
jgi:putative membrane protein